MNILYYDYNDKNIDMDQIKQLWHTLNDNSDDVWIFLPKSIDVLQNCSINQLLGTKKIIEDEINQRTNMYYSHPVQLRFWNAMDKEYQWGIGIHDAIIRADGDLFDTKEIEDLNKLITKKDVDDLYIEYNWKDLTKFQINSGIDEI